MDLIMDIIGDLLEGLFKLLAKSSFNSLGKKFKGEESDDRIVDETWDEESQWDEIGSPWDEEGQWEEVGSQWNEEKNQENQWEEIGSPWNEINYKNEEDYANEANNESKVEHLNESNYSNKFKNLRGKNSLFNIYITGKSKTNRIEDCKNIEYKANKNTISTNIQENKKSDLLFNSSQDSDDNIKQSDINQTSYDVQQNNNQIDIGLEFNKCALRNAIIYSEILGKPKAKSRRRCRNWN